MGFNLKEIFSAFMVLMAIIDPFGSIPVVIDLKSKGNIINPLKVSLISTLVMLVFLIGGEGILAIFSVDVHAFAVAGALILLVYAIEMTLGVQIMKNDSPDGSATIVPLVFPLIAGAGVITTLISMRAEYQMVNIVMAVILNMILVFFILKYVERLQKHMGPNTLYILRKVFGIILLAISTRMLSVNLAFLFK